jgi:26S proteasome regulatory subunit N6
MGIHFEYYTTVVRSAVKTKMAEPVEYMEEEELVDELVSEFDAAKAANKTDAYIRILGNSRSDDPALKVKEQCIYSLARLYSAQKQLHELMPLLKTNNEFFAAIPKARTAKIVRVILDLAGEAQEAGSNDKQVQLCRDVIAWCVAEKRTFLRQRVEGKLASLLLDQKTTTSTHEALKMINSLLAELKKLDDKQLLTETHLAEARIYHAMENIPKCE